MGDHYYGMLQELNRKLIRLLASGATKTFYFGFPHSGEALDLFYRFGFFSLLVRVVPRDDPGSWIIREPTADIFARDSIVRMQNDNPAPAFDRTSRLCILYFAE